MGSLVEIMRSLKIDNGRYEIDAPISSRDLDAIGTLSPKLGSGIVNSLTYNPASSCYNCGIGFNSYTRQYGCIGCRRAFCQNCSKYQCIYPYGDLVWKFRECNYCSPKPDTRPGCGMVEYNYGQMRQLIHTINLDPKIILEKVKLRPLRWNEWDVRNKIEEYVETNHGPTHNQFKLKVDYIVEMERYGERDAYLRRYGHLNNKRLLWHGSATQNFASIIENGLLIAPKGVANGTMFGEW